MSRLLTRGHFCLYRYVYILLEMLNDKDGSINQLLLPRIYSISTASVHFESKILETLEVHLILGHPEVETSTKPTTTLPRNPYPEIKQWRT